ncbi:unnamed protein product [Pelagomonas calceolata]|uniref:AB hydrolase-1 domain-containing protein n=1 Tax=Pelagomonas calceolata TaxID=35677 RepID=A0A7S3ZWH1_9STRA|nr:unnamed protein product [Pelagomonas calceolata]|mmetsp:Transcript_10852/g.32034  ORF Transcript_10852/g.32034 Transcript_10852/m.32034 type:complete len:422 (-) Transcript_10852:197-1462(-)
MAPRSKKMEAASRVASESEISQSSGNSCASETTRRGTTLPQTTYCHYLGGLGTVLDRMVRIPKLIIDCAKYALVGSGNYYKKRESHKSNTRPLSLKHLYYFAAGIVVAMATVDQYTVFKLLTPLLISKIPWHTGAEWKQYLDIYDGFVEARLSHCEHRQISTRYGSTMVHVCGSATDDTVMLLSGTRASSLMWDIVANHAELSRHRRLVLVDHICDAGRSVPVACPDTANDHVAWFEDIYAELGVESADLVGYSYGCFPTALVAITAPSMVKKVIHLGPPFIYGNIPTRMLRKMLLATIAAPFPGLGLDTTWLLGSTAHRTVDEVAQREFATYEVASAVPYNYFHAIPYELSDAELAQLATTNVTAVLPEYEVIMDVQQVTSRLTNAQIRVEIMKDAGHRVRIEDPDSLLEIIARLLLTED